MKIVAVDIDRFRGIQQLRFKTDAMFICLVGAGDSTKTTILKAIELALSPQRNIVFYDADFFNADVTQSVRIEVTLTELPSELITESKFGRWIKGYTPDHVIRDEPQGRDAEALTIRLEVDESLEPRWLVVNERSPEGVRISSYDRARLGVSRIGNYSDWQLGWSQGSILSRLMDEQENVHGVLASASRTARALIDVDKLPLLKASAERAQRIGAKVGVAARHRFRPHLDARNMSTGAGILALHDGHIPARQAGSGTSRLLTLALQHEAAREGGITLIDEIEHGLEPHRLRRLLNVLLTGQRLDEQEQRLEERTQSSNQTWATTHAAIAISELQPEHLAIVRSNNGNTTIQIPDSTLRPLLRKHPEAFLAHKIVVCEGKTELGFFRALDKYWAKSGKSLAYAGAALVDGNGSEAPKTSQSFRALGYDTAHFGDSDSPLNPDRRALETSGVGVFLWEGQCCIEERIALDLPWEGFLEMVQMASTNKDPKTVRETVAAQLPSSAQVSNDPTEWRSAGVAEELLRKAFGRAAHDGGWFKRVDLSEPLGELVVKHRDAVGSQPLGVGIRALKNWIFPG